MNETEKFLKKLKNHPDLEERFNEILDIAENASGEPITADQAEEKAIEALKKLGVEVLQGWAKSQHDQQLDQFAKNGKSIKKTKKNSTGKQHLEK